METFFKFATPIVYWILIIVWALISIFYFKKIRQLKGYGKFLKLLLIILAIDAARSFFESLYFGAWYTSYSGLLPISLYNFLANPEIVFIPKIINLIVAVLILVLIIKKWLEYELVELNATFDRQGVEINKLSTAVNQSANSIVITDLRGNIEYTNPKFTKITGYTAEEALGKNPRILNSGEQAKEYYADMWKIISTGEIWNGEFKNKKKSGEFYWEEVTISPIKNDAGEIINYLAIKNDISKLKQNEKKLKKQNIELSQLSDKLTEKNRQFFDSKNKFKKLFDKSPVSIMEQDFSEAIKLLNKKKAETSDIETYLNENLSFVKKCVSKIDVKNVNEITLSLLGVKNLEELKIHFVKTNTEKSFLSLKNELVSIALGKKDFYGKTEFIKSDGTILYAIIKSTMIDDNGGNIASIVDITEITKVQEELIVAKEKAEESETRFKEFFENAADAIIIAEIETGLIVDANKTASQLLQKSINQIVGLHQTQLHPENKIEYAKDTFTKHKQELQKENPILPVENIVVRTDGTLVPVEILASVIKVEGKNYIMGTFRDISLRKKADNLLKKRNKELSISKKKAEESDQLKTEFINNMSHEIRTPMNGIIGFSDMLSQNDISNEKRANFIKIIQSSGQQLLNVIDDILDISRLGTKQVKVIETNVCLNDVLLELFSTFDIKAKEHKTPLYLKKVLSDKQSTIRTDKTKLNKVLSNLLENALKFTNEGFIELGYQLKNDDIVLYVKDTGIGIENSKHKSIFERFSQAEKELSKNVGGLGLGLSIAKENAKLLGGSILLESKEGKGATFFVTIPYKPVYKVNDIEKAKTEPKYSILIAEDEETNYLYLETLLKDVIGLDCKIIHVTNGKDAIEGCKENKTIDLVLMDIKMPEMNGLEATKLIKKIRPNLPIIAQTAYSTLQEKEQVIEAGCDDFISKPIHQKSFKNILDKYIIKI